MSPGVAERDRLERFQSLYGKLNSPIGPMNNLSRFHGNLHSFGNKQENSNEFSFVVGGSC